MNTREEEQLKQETSLTIPFAAMAASQMSVGMPMGTEIGMVGLEGYLACQMLTELNDDEQEVNKE